MAEEAEYLLQQEAAARDAAWEHRMRRLAQAYLRRDVPSFQELQRMEDERFFNSSPLAGLRARCQPLHPPSAHPCARDASAPPGRPFVLAHNSWLHRDLRQFVRDSEENEIAERHLARGFHIGLGRTFRQANLFGQLI